MAVVSFAGLLENFRIEEDYIQSAPGAVFSNAGDVSAWETENGGVTGVTGGGFTFLGDSLTGGTIFTAGVKLTGPGLGPAFSDMYITDLNLDATLLGNLHNNSLTADQQNNVFWQTVLSGDDFIDIGPGFFSVRMAGDGRNADAGSVLYGGADHIVGGSVYSLSGDIMTVEAGAVVYGGADIIQANGSGNRAGDAFEVSGYLIGGNDVLLGLGSGVVSGDAFDVDGSGVVVGGDDTIIRGSLSAISYGDMDEVDGGGSLYSGNDVIIGGQSDDTIYGDTSEISDQAVAFFGGDDVLLGGAGDDTIYGDWTVNALGGVGVGGSDYLAGGQGNDDLFGNDGDDVLDGGGGEDLIDGGQGFDTASYVSANSFVFADLRSPTVSFDGNGSSDTLVSIEALHGSNFNDFLVGDDASNVLVGNAGNDYVYGLGGNDYILGGLGSEVIYGGEGYDSFVYRVGDMVAGVYDVISDFSESSTSFDTMRFEGISAAEITYVQSGSDVVVTTNALAYAGGVVIEDFTVAQLADQLVFA